MRKFPNPRPTNALSSAQYLVQVQNKRDGFRHRDEEADRSECIEVNQNNRDGFKPNGEDTAGLVGGAGSKSAVEEVSKVPVPASTTTATARLDSKSVIPTYTASSPTASHSHPSTIHDQCGTLH